MGTQGKLGKDAVSEVCLAHESAPTAKPLVRTPIQRRHACSRLDLHAHGTRRSGDDLRRLVDVVRVEV
jgi:hypothetical protein